MEEAVDPSLAPPVPDALPEGQAMQAVAALSQKRPSVLWRFAVWAFGALFSFALSVAAYDFVTGLMARNVVLGWIAFALVILAVLAGLVLALREWGAFLRLGRLDSLRARAVEARAAADLKGARRVVSGLVGLYSARGDTAWGRARLAEREGEVMDADALLALAERELLTTLDAEARLVIEGAARQVATVTALVPLALADVAMALVANLRMIRRIAEIYGGRSGSFGSLKLLRRVFGSLLAAGALALTDDMIGSVAGGGVLSKLSRRFGEGVVNGALTARVGVAAMELCRPMPFVALERPAVSSLVSRALTGLVSRG
ncbi:YcjF family protein [Rhodobacter sp. SY28-1]|uniref:YcjF family protein n=1 Tax=Rhodobacter sp. SY28-1 TaxID=2562317 RepID=UPI0010C10608|nr:TIGR01620 family protein [Rhodobacter sp. SY28-1]